MGGCVWTGEWPGCGVVLGCYAEFHACVTAWEDGLMDIWLGIEDFHIQGASEQYIWSETSWLRAKGWK
jgi:hypothetical protein